MPISHSERLHGYRAAHVEPCSVEAIAAQAYCTLCTICAVKTANRTPRRFRPMRAMLCGRLPGIPFSYDFYKTEQSVQSVQCAHIHWVKRLHGDCTTARFDAAGSLPIGLLATGTITPSASTASGRPLKRDCGAICGQPRTHRRTGFQIDQRRQTRPHHSLLHGAPSCALGGCHERPHRRLPYRGYLAFPARSSVDLGPQGQRRPAEIKAAATKGRRTQGKSV